MTVFPPQDPEYSQRLASELLCKDKEQEGS